MSLFLGIIGIIIACFALVGIVVVRKYGLLDSNVGDDQSDSSEISGVNWTDQSNNNLISNVYQHSSESDEESDEEKKSEDKKSDQSLVYNFDDGHLVVEKDKSKDKKLFFREQVGPTLLNMRPGARLKREKMNKNDWDPLDEDIKDDRLNSFESENEYEIVASPLKHSYNRQRNRWNNPKQIYNYFADMGKEKARQIKKKYRPKATLKTLLKDQKKDLLSSGSDPHDKGGTEKCLRLHLEHKKLYRNDLVDFWQDVLSFQFVVDNEGYPIDSFSICLPDHGYSKRACLLENLPMEDVHPQEQKNEWQWHDQDQDHDQEQEEKKQENSDRLKTARKAVEKMKTYRSEEEATKMKLIIGMNAGEFELWGLDEETGAALGLRFTVYYDILNIAYWELKLLNEQESPLIHIISTDNGLEMYRLFTDEGENLLPNQEKQMGVPCTLQLGGFIPNNQE